MDCHQSAQRTCQRSVHSRDNWMTHRTQESTPELQKQIEAKKSEIRLQLNPIDPEDKR